MAKVAFFTFGFLREAAEHPQMQPFWDRNPHNFEAAEQSDGFLDRSRRHPETGQYDWGNSEDFQFLREEEYGRERSLWTLSVWEDLESVFAFAYAGVHAEALSHRKEWFLKPEWPSYVAWWVAEGHTPTWREAVERHKYLHEHGSSPSAFDFKQPFGADGKPLELDRTLVKVKMERNALKGNRNKSATV